MKVKAKMNLLYGGAVYKAGEIFDMDDVTAAISAKYNRIEILEGAAVEDTDSEMEVVEGLPPFEPPVKKKK